MERKMRETREIKFRVWDGRPVFRRMIPWDVLVKEYDLGILREVGDGFVPMQFTGLKDKNGKDIYEDDLVDHPVDPYLQNPYIVAFKNGCFSVDLNRKVMARGMFYGMPPHGGELSLCEVIGNVHENPELVGTARNGSK